MDEQTRRKQVLEIAKKAHKNSMPHVLKKMYEEKTMISGTNFIMYDFNDYWNVLVNLPRECFGYSL